MAKIKGWFEQRGESMKSFAFLIGIILSWAAIAFVSIRVGEIDGRAMQKAEDQKAAIAANVAFFDVDKKTGVTSFIYLKPDDPEFHQKKAIEAGVALYNVNPKTGERAFSFVAPKANVIQAPAKVEDKSGLSIRIPEPPNKES